MDFLKKTAKLILKLEARLVLKKYKPKIIAITGSVGKTLTREAIYLVLSKKHFVRKSEKSFTAELGIALTILGCSYGSGGYFRWIENVLIGLKLLFIRRSYPEWLILEIDIDKLGDLQNVSSIITPDILVMTEIGDVPAHIEYFPSMESFMLEKKYIIDAVKRKGVIIYNVDDRRVSSLVQGNILRKVLCGIGGNCDVGADSFQILYGKAAKFSVPTGMSFEINHDSKKYPVTILGSLGVQNEYALLLAFAVGLEFGIQPQDIVLTLNKFSSIPGRMKLISGLKDTVIIDDSYNASPVAMVQSIDILGRVKSSGKRIAVIGDMLELGKYSSEEHKKVAELLKDKATNVICVGIRARKIAEELLSLEFDESKIRSVDTAEEAGGELQELLESGDVALIKGSQAMRMEKVVEEVMRHPEDKGKLLVRQEEEWLAR